MDTVIESDAIVEGDRRDAIVEGERSHNDLEGLHEEQETSSSVGWCFAVLLYMYFVSMSVNKIYYFDEFLPPSDSIQRNKINHVVSTFIKQEEGLSSSSENEVRK